jgi:hypothetical protein
MTTRPEIPEESEKDLKNLMKVLNVKMELLKKF